MYDIIFLGSKNSQWNSLKKRFPLAKHAETFDKAKKVALTEFFWLVYDDLIVDDSFEFDYIPDAWSKEYVHVFLNKDVYDGICLIPKSSTVSENEIRYRFFVNKKEIDIVASYPKPFDLFYIDSYDDYLDALQTTTTEMFWMSSRNILHTDIVNEFYINHHAQQDRKQTHAFVHLVFGKKLYNGLFLCSVQNPLSKNEVEHRFPVNRIEHNTVGSTKIDYEKYYPKTYEDYLDAMENSKTEMFWLIPDYVNPTDRFKFDTYFTHDNEYDRSINHAYLNGKYHDGIVLCSKAAKFSRREFDYKFIANKKEVPVVISTPKPYDIVFISYQEPNADKNYERLLKRFPNSKRVHGVKGIHQAHIEGAKLCDTHMFWIVDGDAVVLDEFNFDYQCAQWDKDTVHVWRSINPINDLIYGYGGVKLFPTQKTIDMDLSKPDMTTSISDKFRAVGELSVITGFNTGEFETWKSAFRECCKLSSRVIDRQNTDETQERLNIWTSVGAERKYGDYAIAGAKAGKAYGEQNAGNIEALRMINDFDWLKEKFDATT